MNFGCTVCLEISCAEVEFQLESDIVKCGTEQRHFGSLCTAMEYRCPISLSWPPIGRQVE